MPLTARMFADVWRETPMPIQHFDIEHYAYTVDGRGLRNHDNCFILIDGMTYGVTLNRGMEHGRRKKIRYGQTRLEYNAMATTATGDGGNTVW